MVWHRGLQTNCVLSLEVYLHQIPVGKIDVQLSLRIDLTEVDLRMRACFGQSEAMMAPRR
jgi:hypothetical protein